MKDFSNIKEMYGYVIRYAVLPSNLILNMQGPDQFALPNFTEDGDRIREATAREVIIRRNQKDNFYNILEEDILKYGVENPILVYAGKVHEYLERKVHPDIRSDPSKMIIGVHGGSRLYIAQKHNLNVPCVIIDWIDRFKDAKLITSEQELLKVYKSQPVKYKINSNGLIYNALPQHHLER
ncbi:MAG: hypothetical protein HC836_40715 [Richelia sp. RM2_1_2]|nr:hypothetical protein [Richelia sp. RM2_1_2]